MVKILFGNEPYVIDKAIEEEEKKISQREINVSFCEGLSSEVLALCRTYPFLDARRLVVVTVESLTDEVKKFLDIPDFTSLFILPEKVSQQTKLFKELKSAQFIEEKNKLSEKQLQVFVLRFLKANGGKITEKAFRFLMERTSYLEDSNVNLYTIEVYLKQLLLLGSAITEKEIERIIPPTSKEDVFVLSKALTSGDAAYTIWLCRQFLERGEQPIAILSLLLRPFRLGLKACLFSPAEQAEACAMIGVTAYQIKGIACYPEEILNQAIDIIQDGISGIKKGGGDNMFLLTMSKLIFVLHPERMRCAK